MKVNASKTNIAMINQNTPNKLSRRIWLRDAAIATTGAVVLPSLLTGCDHREDIGKGGLGDTQLTASELENAAENLRLMSLWIKDVYRFSPEYEISVWGFLKSGNKPPVNFTDFAIDTILDIAARLLEAAFPEAALEIGAAFALIDRSIKLWESATARPPELDKALGQFTSANLKMQEAVEEKLNLLRVKDNNYQNLRNQWNEFGSVLEYGGNKYTLKDLATTTFPSLEQGSNTTQEYQNMLKAARTGFKQSIWNVLFKKAGNLKFVEQLSIGTDKGYTPTEYARDVFYKNNKSRYLRGYYRDGYYYLGTWRFDFDGLELSDDAAAELFIDDTPGHILNPNPDPDPKKHGKPLTGLFARDYVFKQFHTTKPNFSPYHELRKDSSLDPRDNGTDRQGFDHDTDDFDFTGGVK